jgi:hypothetical protein
MGRKPKTIQGGWEVLSCVWDHLPSRTRARLRCVCKDLSLSSVPAPIYAPLIDALTCTIRQLRFSSCVVEVEGATISVYRSDASEDEKIMVEIFMHDKVNVVTTCQPQHFKNIMYRAVDKNKYLTRSKASLEEALLHIAQRWAPVCVLPFLID